jgi:acetylglutamate kinase
LRKNVDDENSVISSITKTKYKQFLTEGVISKGMIPKLDNAFEAIQNGVKSVMIAHSNELINTISENEHAGTKLIA